MERAKQRAPEKKDQEARLSYCAPAVIYEGVITTRAGSPPIGAEEIYDTGVDPSDLFGGGSNNP